MACPICGSNKAETIFTHARLANAKRTFESKESQMQFMTNLNTDLCMGCGMLYRNPLMTVEEQGKYYSNEYVEKYKPVPLVVKEETHDAKLKRKITDYLKHFDFLDKNDVKLKEKRIIDVGCGGGWFLASLRKKYSPSHCLGIEPSVKRSNEINSRKEFGFSVINSTIHNVNANSVGKFDLILLVGVLEHLSDPKKDLAKCRDFMHNDSYIYIYTHNESPTVFIDLKKRISAVHQQYFTARTITLLLREVGLEMVCIKCVQTDMQILARMHELQLLKINLSKPKYVLVKMQYLINRLLPSLFFSFSFWLDPQLLMKRILKIWKKL